MGIVFVEDVEEGSSGSVVGGGEPLVRVYGAVQGLNPGLHGIHVHAAGDISNGCASTCEHFDPDITGQHGGLKSEQSKRHAGDWGNLSVPPNGKASFEFLAPGLTVRSGDRSILGRSVVVHAEADDEGTYDGPNKALQQGSKTTGNSGARVLCGVIGIARDEECPQAKTTSAPFDSPERPFRVSMDRKGRLVSRFS